MFTAPLGTLLKPREGKPTRNTGMPLKPREPPGYYAPVVVLCFWSDLSEFLRYRDWFYSVGGWKGRLGLLVSGCSLLANLGVKLSANISRAVWVEMPLGSSRRRLPPE